MNSEETGNPGTTTPTATVKPIYDTVVVEETGILDGESESEERIDSLKQEIRRNRDSLKENAKALKEEIKKNR